MSSISVDQKESQTGEETNRKPGGCWRHLITAEL